MGIGLGVLNPALLSFGGDGEHAHNVVWLRLSVMNSGFARQEETRKIVFRGERGPMPPIFVANNSTDVKRGAKIFSPPNI